VLVCVGHSYQGCVAVRVSHTHVRASVQQPVTHARLRLCECVKASASVCACVCVRGGPLCAFVVAACNGARQRPCRCPLVERLRRPAPRWACSVAVPMPHHHLLLLLVAHAM
jgi:hypothetical protein